MRQSLYLFFFFSLFISLNADELAKKTSNLKENQRIQKQLNKKLEDLASDILKGQKKLKSLGTQINSILSKTKDTKEKALKNAKELSSLNKENIDLKAKKNQMESKLINLIAKDFAYDLALSNDAFLSIESVIVGEIVSSLDVILKDEFYKLSFKYSIINKEIESKQKKIRGLNEGLKKYEIELNKLQALKKDQEKELKEQKQNKQIYATKIKNLEKQQKELRQTLANLKIIKEGKTPKDYEKNAKAPRVIGGGYESSKIKRYSGAKTIAPLDGYTIKQKFGNFTDPIYKIKIFNENVVLRSTEENAPVKSVLKGKVVFAQNTAVLQNVVIIEHAAGIHTIYAHLDRIAPTIKAGRNIREGYIIGRVARDLTFEVTQKNYHINPLELIN